MNALSKTPVSRKTVQAIIAAHFGRRAHVREYVELTDGYYNAAYRVVLEDGRPLVLKVAPTDDVPVLGYERNIMEAEVDALRLVPAQTDLPVPEVLAHDSSRRLLDADYFLMTYLSGVGLHKMRAQLTAAEQQAIDFQLGIYLRQINAIRGARFGYFALPESGRESWRETFARMIDGVLADGRARDIPLPIPDDDLIARITPLYPALDAVIEPRLVHWDLWDGNVHIDPRSKQISGIFDFERVLWGIR